MSEIRLRWARELKAAGRNIGREGMSLRAIEAVSGFDGTYKGAMILAGRLKAIAQMAKSDDYWDEQVEKGYRLEICSLTSPKRERVS